MDLLDFINTLLASVTEDVTQFNFNQAITAASAVCEFLGATLFLCFFLRNWTARFRKGAYTHISIPYSVYQLCLSLALVFYSLALRDAVSTLGWWYGLPRVNEFLQTWRLVLQVPRIPMIVGLLIAIRVLSYGIYKNNLTVAAVIITVVVFIAGLIL